MSISRLRRNKEKKKKLAHIIAGFTILIHAYERYEGGHDTYLWFAIAGIVFMCVAALHHQIAKKAPWVDGVFFVIEACLSFIVAQEYFHAGKKALPWCYVAIGVFQLVIAVVMGRKGVRKRREMSDEK